MIKSVMEIKHGISVVIPVKNEEKNLKALIPQLIDWVDEILIMDDYSIENTSKVISPYGDKVRYYPETPWNMSQSINIGIDKCGYVWILHLDADERITPQLRQEIQEVLKIPLDNSPDTFEIARLGFIGKKSIKSCGWYPDWAIRLFKKGKAYYPEKMHFKMVSKGSIGKLKSHILHYSYRDISHYLQKIDLYSTFLAKNIYNGDVNKIGVWVKIFLKFPYKYFVQKGFKDGIYGFMISLMDPIYYILGYLKYIEMKRYK